MRKASWILLTVVGCLWLTSTLFSSVIAYHRPQQHFVAGKAVLELPVSDEVKTAIRAQRGTAAAYAAALVALYLIVVTGPYRRGDKWAWWALLIATAVLLVLTLPRIHALGTPLGVVAAALPFGLTLVGLLLDVRRLRS
jgi:hypothetical protein